MEVKSVPVHVWAYEPGNRNFPGYHLTGDAPGLDYLADHLSAPQHPDKKTLLLSVSLAPTTKRELQVPNCPTAAKSFSRLDICVRYRDTSDLLEISASGTNCRLELASSRLPDLLKGFDDIKRGHGDYAISGASSALWFWWKLNN
jgi:hypothetical protein